MEYTPNLSSFQASHSHKAFVIDVDDRYYEIVSDGKNAYLADIRNPIGSSGNRAGRWFSVIDMWRELAEFRGMIILSQYNRP